MRQCFSLEKLQYSTSFEVTLARAVELKHKNSLISALSSETSKMFMMAGDHLSTLDQLQVGKWKKYSGIKEAFYKSYVRN